MALTGLARQQPVALASIVTCWITFGSRFPAAADARMYRMARRRVGKGEFTVHDLENIGDHEMVFVIVEFKDSANMPIALPSGGTPQ